MKLGLREANQQFAKVVRAVRAGREVTLTDRGKPIAVIKPIAEHDPDKAYEQMVAEGFIIPPAKKGRMDHSNFKPIKVKGKSLSQTIIEDREDRF